MDVPGRERRHRHLRLLRRALHQRHPLSRPAPPRIRPRWADAFARWWCGWACLDQPVLAPSVGFAIGQNFYTPDDLSIAELIPDDRPFAGWLYGAALLQITDDQLSRQHAFELQLGIIGPESGAEWVQTKIHELLDDQPPLGWDNQLPTEPAINLIYRYRRRVGGQNLDLVPHVGGALGTIMVSANAGATVRAGWNISGFPQNLIPTTLTAPESGERPKWELYLFAGADGRAVAHNIFLDGTVFSDSHSVDKEDFVYDLTERTIPAGRGVSSSVRCPRSAVRVFAPTLREIVGWIP